MTDEATGRAVRLTKRTVDAAETRKVRWILWDSDLKGFGLKVEKTGRKTFIVRYRVGGGRRGTLREFKIGAYGKLTADEARAEAKIALARVETGKDPQADRAADRKTLTVAELCDLYLAEGMGTKKASTVTLDTIRIARHIKPLLGSRKITEVDAGDVERMMNAIAAGKVKDEDHPHTRGGRTAATKSVKLLGAIYEFAMARKLCAENPRRGVKVFADQKRDRFLSPAELGKLGEALTAAEADGAHPYHVAIIRLLALTGARKNEIAMLRWLEIKDGYLQLEDSKTGRKVVPLGAAAQEVLSGIPATKSAYVFPDPRDASIPIRNLDWAWVGIRKRAGMPDLRIHDLRHSFASVGVSGGAGLYLIGKLLGHNHVATTSRYAHLHDDPVKAAADKISATVAAALKGQSADVDPISGAAQ